MRFFRILVMIFLSAIAFTSCTRDGIPEDPKNTEKLEYFVTSHRYMDTSELFPLPEDVNIAVLDCLYVRDGKPGLVYQVLNVPDTTTAEPRADTVETAEHTPAYSTAKETVLWLFDPETRESMSVPVSSTETDLTMWGLSLHVFRDLGSVYVYYDDSLTYLPNDRHLIFYQPGGEHDQSVSVAAVYPGGMNAESSRAGILSGRDILYLYDSDRHNLLAFDRNGEFLGNIAYPAEWSDPEFFTSGSGYVIIRHRNPQRNILSYEFALLDEDTLTVTPLPVPETEDEYTYFDTELRRYTRDKTGLWQYDEAGEKVLLCDWEQSDLMNSAFLQMTVVSPDLIYYSMRDSVTGRLRVGKLTPEADGTAARKRIKIAATEYAAELLERQVTEFNQNSTDYHAEFTIYQANLTTGESATQMLGKDIINGHVPDIILCGDEISESKMRALGVCADLLPLMAEDGRYAEDDFLPSMIRCRKTEDGKLLSLILNFKAKGYVCTPETAIGEKNTYVQLLELSQTLPEGQTFFVVDKDFTAEEMEKLRQINDRYNKEMDALNSERTKIDPFSPKINDIQKRGEELNNWSAEQHEEIYRNHDTPALDMLKVLLDGYLSDAVDKEHGVCTFDTEDFRAFLTLCKEHPVLYPNKVLSTRGQLDAGVRMTEFSAGDIISYLYLKTFVFPDGVRIIGTPVQEEHLSENSNGILIEPVQEFVITKNSPVQDGAWDFIVSCIEMQTEEQSVRDPLGKIVNYTLDPSYEWLPCTNTGLEAMYARFRSLTFSIKDLGLAGIVDSERKSYETDSAVRERLALTKEDCARLTDLIKNAGRCVETDEELKGIIIEEASAYFAGTYDLETTVKTIQSRASIYMSEQFG